MVRSTIPEEESLEILLQTEILDEDSAETLLQEYQSPGHLYQDLHYHHFTETVDDVNLPVNPTQLYRELSRNGVNYYTGIIETLPEPSDILEYTEPNGDSTRYQLLGREVCEQPPAHTHYYRVDSEASELVLWLFQQSLDGTLEPQEKKKLTHSPAPRLQKYVENREWDILRQPDYQMIESELSQNTDSGVDWSPEVDEGQSQLTW